MYPTNYTLHDKVSRAVQASMFQSDPRRIANVIDLLLRGVESVTDEASARGLDERALAHVATIRRLTTPTDAERAGGAWMVAVAARLARTELYELGVAMYGLDQNLTQLVARETP